MSRRTRRPTPEPDPYLTALEAAALLKISKRTLEDWRQLGTGPRFVRLGSGPRSRVRYRRSDIDAWADSHS